MKIEILKETTYKDRLLLPGNEIDTDVMPIYEEAYAEQLIASGHAQLAQPKIAIQAVDQEVENEPHDEREPG